MQLPNSQILISESDLQNRITSLAHEINQHYAQNAELIVVSVLKGSVFFMTDLCKQLQLDVEIGFLFLSSYQGKMSPQTKVQLFDLPLPDLKNRNLLIIEDIYDSGASLKYAYELCLAFQPASIKTCVLLAKQGKKNQAQVPLDYVGFHIPNHFVVGYGLDYQEKYRQLPYIAVLDNGSDE